MTARFRLPGGTAGIEGSRLEVRRGNELSFTELEVPMERWPRSERPWEPGRGLSSIPLGSLAVINLGVGTWAS